MTRFIASTVTWIPFTQVYKSTWTFKTIDS